MPKGFAVRRRSVRAAEALEYAGTPAAGRALEQVAKQAPGSRLRREAKAALERLDLRGAK